MLAAKWGVKSFYYDLRDKQGAKSTLKDESAAPPPPLVLVVPSEAPYPTFNSPKVTEYEDPDSCEACKL